jgi:chemotaxis methyl-accepting protein methylase
VSDRDRARGTPRRRSQVEIDSYAGYIDVDDEALARARHAAYTPAEVEGLSEAQLERYFELQGSRYCFRKDLRRSVIFGRNDLVQDAPISRVFRKAVNAAVSFNHFVSHGFPQRRT